MNVITVRKPGRMLKGTIHLPSSKSISNRLLVIRSLTDRSFRISNLSDSEDTKRLSVLLDSIEKNIGSDKEIILDTANAGTVMRFLVGLVTTHPGKWILTGDERMKQRPVRELVSILRQMGASIEYLKNDGFPPVRITGGKLQGGHFRMDPGVSSQYISSLLMLAPEIRGGATIELTGKPVSYPYVEMTIRLMSDLGVMVQQDGNILKIPQNKYVPADYLVENDWSAAAFWYEAAALSEEADLLLAGLTKESLQGDKVVADLFRIFGVRTEYEKKGVRLTKTSVKTEFSGYDFSGCPDLAPAVITACGAMKLDGCFTGLESLRFKESDRIQALQNELGKLNIRLQSDQQNGKIAVMLRSSMLKSLSGIRFQTYDDHRMAMAFAVLAIHLGEVEIESPEVISKSYPGFWNDLRLAGFEIF